MLQSVAFHLPRFLPIVSEPHASQLRSCSPLSVSLLTLRLANEKARSRWHPEATCGLRSALNADGVN